MSKLKYNKNIFYNEFKPDFLMFDLIMIEDIINLYY